MIQKSPAKTNDILHDPQDIEFHVAMREIEEREGNTRILGHEIDPRLEPVHIKANMTLGIPTSEVADIDFKSQKPTLFINFLGLAGRLGPLPSHISDLVLERSRIRDTGLRHFLDLFHQRLAGLWYRLRRKCLTGFVRLEPQKSPMGASLLQMGGVASTTLFENTVLPSNLPLAAHQLFWGPQRTASGLKSLLESYWEFPFEVKEFCGGWTHAPASIWTRLGNMKGQYNKLGTDVLLGKRVWEQTQGLQVIIGPLDWDIYNQFWNHDLPRGGLFNQIREMIFFYLGIHFKISICIKLNPRHVQFLRLNHTHKVGYNAVLFSGNKDTLLLQHTRFIENPLS